MGRRPGRTMRPHGRRRRRTRRCRARRVAVESGPVSEDVESLADEISALGEFLRRPASLLLIVMSLLALIADRHVLSG